LTYWSVPFLMRKIDKLILKSFIGPFVGTFFTVVFILLTRHMLMYFDDIIGKDLGWAVLGELLFHFAVFMIPAALPLAILLSCLIVFGGLGEHFELTAIKSAGISLPRILLPIFIVVVFLTAAAFYANNHLVPRSALKAFSLIYDIKNKKPALDLREGVFYNEIPGVSIKVNKKFPYDDAALKGVILYDHASEQQSKLTLADSGRMSSVYGDRYLKFELFNGLQYAEGDADQLVSVKNSRKESLTKTAFVKTEVFYDLSSFDLTRTKAELFEGDRLMRSLDQLDQDIKFVNNEIDRLSSQRIDIEQGGLGYSEKSAADRARTIKDLLQTRNAAINNAVEKKTSFEIQWHRILANSAGCLILFLIGAPLGAIIKRGDIGTPFLISIGFFIVYYVLGIQGGKLATQHFISPLIGIWAANFLLLIIGIFFLRQAHQDTRLFDSDFYHVLLDKLKRRLVRP
jgi:lipopolysaccharide export system permease protein